MKRVIDTLLRTGYSKTQKYKVKDLPYFLKPIFKDIDGFGITCNKNSFWDPTNIENRMKLIHDMQGYNKNIQKGTSFRIINTYENGDAYGIVKDWKE
ncbi:MAG: hypothetical protein ACI37Z_05250 [Candidatus Gastranaerophilaceae bacterium]